MECTPVQAAQNLYIAANSQQVCPCCGASAEVPVSWAGCDMGEPGCEHNHEQCLNAHTHTGQYGCGLWQYWLGLCTVSKDVQLWLLGIDPGA